MSMSHRRVKFPLCIVAGPRLGLFLVIRKLPEPGELTGIVEGELGSWLLSRKGGGR